MSSQDDIKRFAQTLLGVVLTDQAAREAFRKIPPADTQARRAALKQYAGIEVPAAEVDSIIAQTQSALEDLQAKLGPGVRDHYQIVN
jgi:hypothetical protein